MALDSNEISDFFKFQTCRKVTNLYKNFLIILEDLKSPPYNLSEDSFSKLRKRVLDLSNDTLRELDQDFSKINIKLK